MFEPAELILSTLVIPIALALLSFWWLLQRFHQHGLPLPPGPKGNILVGNLLDFPKSHGYRAFAELGRQLNSNLILFRLLGKHVIVINDRKTAEELLERRPKLYSDRPHRPIAGLLGWNENVASMRYGSIWRDHRTFSQQNFRSAAAHTYHPIQLERVQPFLRGLLNSPRQYVEHIKMLSVSITLRMTYGFAPASLDDPFIQLVDESTRLAEYLLTPGKTLIGMLPFLQYIPTWFPGAVTQRKILRCRELLEQVKRIPVYVKS